MDWLEAALRYVERWFDFQMRLTEQPGCVIAVAEGADIVFERTFGMADLSTGEPLTPRHRFRVASHSKTFTAAAIMLLVERGRLRLDDEVGLHVAHLSEALAAAKIGQLLSHTAGIMRDGTDSGHWNDARPFPQEAALREQLSHSLVLAPGERLKYSNLGYGLLGLVIGAVTGEAFETWMAREVVAGTRLTETAPDYAPGTMIMAAGHTGRLPAGRRVVPGRNRTAALAAATGFVSTAADLARFFNQLDPAASHSLLSAASRREMTRRHWKSIDSEAEHYYGFGTVSGSVSGRHYFGHTGAFQGFQSCTSVVPVWGIAVSIIVNAIDGPAGDWMAGVMHIFDRFAKADAILPVVDDWNGRWWNLWGAIDLVGVGDRVIVASPDQLTPFADSSEITVMSRTAGTITRATGFGSFGEAVERHLNAEGTALSLILAGDRFSPDLSPAPSE